MFMYRYIKYTIRIQYSMHLFTLYHFIHLANHFEFSCQAYAYSQDKVLYIYIYHAFPTLCTILAKIITLVSNKSFWKRHLYLDEHNIRLHAHFCIFSCSWWKMPLILSVLSYVGPVICTAQPERANTMRNAEYMGMFITLFTAFKFH